MVQEAFAAGLELVRAAGIEVKANEPLVLSAWFYFERRAEPKQHDPRFEAEAPLFAKKCILEAFIIATDATKGCAE